MIRVKSGDSCKGLGLHFTGEVAAQVVRFRSESRRCRSITLRKAVSCFG
jgi:hypothetical protein